MALVRENLTANGLNEWTDEVERELDHWSPEVPRLRRLRTFGAAMESQVGDERSELDGAFVVRTPAVEYQNRDEADAREAVRDYAGEHGVDAARRDFEVFLRIEATGTTHSLSVERFLD